MPREAKKQPPPSRIRWKLLLRVGGAGGGLASPPPCGGYKVRGFVITDPQFALSRDRKDAITIEGLRYASRWKVQRVFAGDYDRSIYLVPLAERRRRLEAIDWIESATVSRVWPDRLVVRVRERQPIAFVNFAPRRDAGGWARQTAGAAGQGAVSRFPVISGINEDEHGRASARPCVTPSCACRPTWAT